MRDRPALGAVTVTVAVCAIATPLAVADTVLSSETVELRVPEATPIEFVVVAGCVSVFPLPVAVRTIVAPLTGFPKPSFAVTRIVEVSLPGAMLVGAALTADVAPETAPAVTVTATVCVIATPSAVAEMVFSSALFDDSVPVTTPLASVVPEGCTKVF